MLYVMVSQSEVAVETDCKWNVCTILFSDTEQTGECSAFCTGQTRHALPDMVLETPH